MAEAEAGSIGARLDLYLRAGDTLGPYTATLKNNAGVAVNLTGYTFTGAVSKLNDADGDVALTCTITDAVNGKVQFKLASTTSMGTSTSNFFVASATYSWYLKGTDSVGSKQTYLYGYVKVARELPT